MTDSDPSTQAAGLCRWYHPSLLKVVLSILAAVVLGYLSFGAFRWYSQQQALRALNSVQVSYTSRDPSRPDWARVLMFDGPTYVRTNCGDKERLLNAPESTGPRTESGHGDTLEKKR